MSESNKVFLDTNLLVYCVDVHDRAKQRRARRVLRTVMNEGHGVVSTQVLQEFYVAATRKLGVAPMVAKGMINALRGVELVVVDREIIGEAIDCSLLDQISFWDALIVVCAERAKCASVLTEDLSDGQRIRDVLINNPFKRNE